MIEVALRPAVDTRSAAPGPRCGSRSAPASTTRSAPPSRPRPPTTRWRRSPIRSSPVAEPRHPRFVAARMRTMGPADFSEMLRTAMREDEWLLYLHGAVLGFGAGRYTWRSSDERDEGGGPGRAGASRRDGLARPRPGWPDRGGARAAARAPRSPTGAPPRAGAAAQGEPTAQVLQDVAPTCAYLRVPSRVQAGARSWRGLLDARRCATGAPSCCTSRPTSGRRPASRLHADPRSARSRRGAHPALPRLSGPAARGRRARRPAARLRAGLPGLHDDRRGGGCRHANRIHPTSTTCTASA